MSDDNFEGRRLYPSAPAPGGGTELIHMSIHPGCVVAPHVAEVDMEFYVLEGRGSFSVGDEEKEAGPGSLVESPKGLAHGIRNSGPGELRLLAIKNCA